MAILTTKNPPTNHMLEESWLDTVLTTADTGAAGDSNTIVTSDADGKIHNDWLYVSSVKLTSSNTPYKNPSTGNSGYIPPKYILQVNGSSGYIDKSFLRLKYNVDTAIINLPANSTTIPLDLIDNTSTGGTANNGGKLVKTNSSGFIDYSLISKVSASNGTSSGNTLVSTNTSGKIDRSFINIKRINRVISGSGVAANGNYSITSTSYNANSSEGSIDIPADDNDLYVFHNGALLKPNYDYTIVRPSSGIATQSNTKFNFINALVNGDILQFISIS